MNEPAAPDTATGEDVRPAFESPLRVRRRVGHRVRQVRALARPYKGEAKRFSKFLVVGALGFAVDFGVFNLLSHGLDISPTLASFISLMCAIVSNFAFNHYWIYHDARGRGKSFWVSFVQFFLVSLTVALFRVPLISITHAPFGELAHTLLGLPAGPAEVVGNNAALIVTVVIGLFWNFFVNRFWTFRHAPGPGAEIREPGSGSRQPDNGTQLAHRTQDDPG